MDTFYKKLYGNDITVWSEKYHIKGYVSKKNEKYYLYFTYNSKEYEYELCPIKEEASLFINSIALWEMEKRLSDFEMEEAYALCIKTKR